MTRKLSHRGPDGERFHQCQGIGFGHRRLSIIDLADGHQPLKNEDGSVVVTYNGEIYNYRELTVVLKAKGHQFRTHCDTEVIVHAWEEWGPACVDRFNGMFAFVLWDANTRSLFMARDRLGIKPLYFSILETDEVIFASELKALLAHKNCPTKLNASAIEDYLTLGYVPESKSIYADIQKLKPGHTLLMDRQSFSSCEQRRYWDVPIFDVQSYTESAAQLQLTQELTESVKRRLVADVPLGAFLSGGVDSSAIVALMKQGGVERLRSYSIGFNEAEFDETRYAELVAQHLYCEHTVQYVSIERNLSTMSKVFDLYDEPYADSSAVPTLKLCDTTVKHVKVALSGDGGDENFAGYPWYGLIRREEAIRNKIPGFLRQGLFGGLSSIFPTSRKIPKWLRAGSTLERLSLESVPAFHSSRSWLSTAQRQKVLTDSFRSSLQGYDTSSIFKTIAEDCDASDPVRVAQYIDFHTYLPSDILTKVDRASMSVGLEVRVPFLDHELVEFVARLPTQYKMGNNRGKYLLKQTLEKMLPHETLNRTKQGFSVPLDDWFRSDLAKQAKELVCSEAMLDAKVFKREELEAVFSDHRAGRQNHGSVIWMLMSLAHFLNHKPWSI